MFPHKALFANIVAIIFLCNVCFAKPQLRHPELITPNELRPRVNFWINVFTAYGKSKVAIHHRDYPQAVFKVLDLSKEMATMSPIAFDHHKSKVIKHEISEIEKVLLKLSKGGKPSTKIEQDIADRMDPVPGGRAKYAEAVKKDLVRSQTGIREKFESSITRSGRYLPIMESIFADYSLPVELTRLPFIESSFDYTAYSSVGAAGIWQFMPRTGRLYKMMITGAVDERRDPTTATIGAARYLQDAYKLLQSWPLAITSYNHGAYGVLKAVRKIGTRDISKIIEAPASQRVFGFASNNFYPEFLAALEVSSRARFFFPEVTIEPPIEFDHIRLTIPHSVKFIETRLGVNKTELMPLNYALSSKVWDGRLSIPSGYVLKVPAGYGKLASKLKGGEPESYAKLVSTSTSSIYGGITYTVRRGDTLGSIARKYKISINDLMQLNGLKGNIIRIGQKLRIKGQEAIRESNTPTKKVVSKSAAIKRHKVRRGESLWTIARKYGVSIDALKRQNKLKKSAIKAGDTLSIP